MSQWPAVHARLVLAALHRIGWTLKRQSSSHRTLARPGWADFVFAFHDGEEIGPRMLARIARRTRLIGGGHVASEMVAECLLFDASPDQVIATCESFGAVRDGRHPWVWVYSSAGDAQIRFRVSVALWADAERLGLGSTIQHEIIADLMSTEWEDWQQSVATALSTSIDEARGLITKRSNVIVRCIVLDPRAETQLRGCVLALVAHGDGRIWSGRRGWTAQALRENPLQLQLTP